jgi:CheY-like chemotaxis protein
MMINGMNPKILIVDDTPIARQGTAMTVQSLGFKTDEAVGGCEAFANVQTHQYALILMDCNMPNLDGIECTQKIREQEKQTGIRIPIIGVSASNDAQTRAKCLQAGMDDYLSKSYTKEELQHIINKWLCF